MAESQEGIRKTTGNGVTTLEFFHPKANSLPLSLLSQLCEAVTAAGQAEECRTIILSSAGKSTFCAGASFQEFQQISNLSEAETFFEGFARLILAMKSCPKLIITKVQGKAVGGGVGLIAASDYAIAAPEASIRLSEFELDLGPFTIGPAVERRLGAAIFSELAIDCAWRDAAWAKRHGLLAKVCTDYQELQQYTQTFAESLSKRSCTAAAQLKKMLWQGTEHWDVLLKERARVTAALLMERLQRLST